MNILFVDTNGAENIFSTLNYQFLKKISNKENLNVIITIGNNYEGILKSLKIPNYIAPLKSKICLKSILTIRHIIKKHKIELIQCQNNRALSNAILATYFLKKKPKIICRRGIIRKISKLDPIEWITYLNPRYTHTIALTNEIKKDLIKESKFNKKHITTIYQAFDPRWLNIDFSFNSRDNLKIPKDSIIIGTVANFRPIKGLDIFIKAINILINQTNIHYVFIGENCKENLIGLLPNKSLQSRVHFLGHQNKPGNYIKDFDIYIQPSRSEGLGFALLEAMMLGICPIVSKVGGMKELVLDNQTGLTFNPFLKESPQKLANLIQYIIKEKHKKEQLAKNAKEFTEKEFDIGKMVKKHIILYENLLNIKSK